MNGIKTQKSMDSKYGVLILSALSVFVLVGCGDIDPWSEMSKASSSPSPSFVGPPDTGGQTRVTSPQVSEFKDQKLTLVQCIQIALERNPQTVSSGYAARAAAARVGQAKSAYLPTVGFVSSAVRGNSEQIDNKPDSSVRNTFDAVFGVRYLLFDGGRRDALVQGVAAELLAANFRYNTILQDIALGVEESYYDLLAAQRLSDLAVETVRQRESHVQIAEARYKTGIVAKSDVLKAQTEKADADLRLVQAENAVRIARGRLANAMGLHVSESFEIVDLSEDVHRLELADIESLLDDAARNRPELQAALAQIEAQRAGVKAAESRFWPAVSAIWDFGWEGRSFFPGQEQWNVGVGLDIPLFTGFDRTYQVHRAKADLAKAVADRQKLLRDEQLEVWTAYSRIIESSQAIDAAIKYVASAEESARVAEGEYKNGTGSIIGLIDAQTARTAARTRLIQTNLDWHMSMARFERAVGRTLAATESFAEQRDKP